MPQHIPNQPIKFEGDSQDCLNNDTTQYTMLMQGCERWHYQLDNTPCGNPEGTICDVKMNQEGVMLVNSSFNSLTEWDAGTQNANIFPASGYAVLYWDSLNIGYAFLTKSITMPSVASGLGVLCKIRYTIEFANTANGKLYFYGTGSKTPIVIDDAPTAGTFERYILLDTDTNSFGINFEDAVDGDFVRFSQASLQIITPCWQSEFDADSDATNKNPYSPAWTYSKIGTQGFFTAQPDWDIYNTATFPANTLTVAFNDTVYSGDALAIEYTITNLTAGSIFAKIGSVSGITRDTEGTFSEYITASSTEDYIEFYTTSDFDGTISIVSGKIFGKCHSFDILDASDNSVVVENIEAFYTNDKIELNINPCSISVISGGEPNDVQLEDGCYRIRFNNCCDDTSDISDTIINYTQGTHDCTSLVTASCEGRALGFDFTGGYKLQHRLRLLKFAPKYKNSGNDATGSDGVKTKTYGKSDKVYRAVVDYCDEYTHDAINAQLQCDTILVDGVEYFAPVQDYEPDWIGRQSRNLSQAEFELQRKAPVIFNRNNI